MLNHQMNWKVDYRLLALSVFSGVLDQGNFWELSSGILECIEGANFIQNLKKT